MPPTGLYEGTTAGTSATWTYWNVTSNSTNVTTATNETWATWAGAGTTSTANVFTIWVNGTITNVRQREQTAEERAAEAARIAKYEKERKEAEAKRLKAEKAALKLFVSLVGRRAYGYFKKRGYHEVIGHSGKRYRVRLGSRVEEMVGNFGDGIAAYLCIHSDYQYGLPQMDTLVQQMLLVMSGEEGEKVLHRTANRTNVAAVA